LDEKLSLAASNGPSLCVVSGAHDAVDAFQDKILAKGIDCRRLHTSHAFHSPMMDRLLEPFTQSVKKVKLNPPQIPFISNVTGTWITAEEATDPSYWARHLGQTVQFTAGISQLLQEPNRILLEVGPGRTLCTFALQHTEQAAGQVVLPSLRHPQDQQSDLALLLNILGRLWLAGVPVNWSSFYAHEQRHRVPLPTYPFERQRYWIETQVRAGEPSQGEIKLAKRSNITDWFYVPSWKRVPLVETRLTSAATLSCYLVFVDECGLGEQIAQRLEQAGQDVITVTVGEQFRKLDRSAYAINPQNRDDYNALMQAIRELGKTPNTIAHLWSITQSPHQSFDTQNLGFYSLMFLTQALGQENLTDSTQLMVVVNNLYDITGDEQLSPEKATISGPCKVIPQEYPQISCRQVDVVVPESGWGKLGEQLMAELTAQPSNSVVAYRGNHRWVKTFEPVSLDAVEAKTRLRQRGVYLITGGMGGMGLVLAQYLAQTVKAKLVLVGRSGLPAKEQWEQWLATHDPEDAISCKIQKVQALEALGAEVLIISADVANHAQMQAAIAQSLKRFGKIHGVIHAAGVAGAGMIQLKTPEIAKSVFAPKLMGTLVLNDVLKDINLDFLVLSSSLSSVLGGFGQVDYCAANAFLDEFAHRNTSINGQFTVAINWDTWQEVGMAVNTAVPDELQKWREESLKNGLLSTEAVDAFSRILGSSLSQVVVSAQDLQAVIHQSNNFFRSHLLPQQSENCTQVSAVRHPRPTQANAYVAPRNEIEQSIADIWQELIGIEKVGIYDNFFELGGHSLLAVQTISRLRETFQVELPLRTLLFEAPTVAEIATVITDSQPKPEELDQMAQLLAEVENLSLKEIQAQLAKESPISNQ
jgi:NAD(P)-dependent dehydrogenase (short-subunit alcohol dehydrogenase family)/acyl carrier protein